MKKRVGLVLRGLGDDIEMPPDFAGKGADPNITGQPVPTTPVIEGAFKNLVGGLASMFGAPATKQTVVIRPGLPARPSILPKVALVGLAIGAIVLLTRRQ